MNSYKRFPVFHNGVSQAKFQWLQYMAEPWALPVYWEWFILVSRGVIPGLFPRRKGWVEPFAQSAGKSTYTDMKLSEITSYSWMNQWEAEPPLGDRVNTRVDISPAFGTPNFGPIATPAFTKDVGDQTAPAFVSHWDWQLSEHGGGAFFAFIIYRMIPHSDCWVPSFDP